MKRRLLASLGVCVFLFTTILAGCANSKEGLLPSTTEEIIITDLTGEDVSKENETTSESTTSEDISLKDDEDITEVSNELTTKETVLVNTTESNTTTTKTSSTTTTKAPVTTTKVATTKTPVTTTKVTTTKAPVTTTKVTTTKAPITTTKAPVTTTKVTTTKAPVTTTKKSYLEDYEIEYFTSSDLVRIGFIPEGYCEGSTIRLYYEDGWTYVWVTFKGKKLPADAEISVYLDPREGLLSEKAFDLLKQGSSGGYRYTGSLHIG